MTDNTRKGDQDHNPGSGHTQDPGRKNPGKHPDGTPEPPAPSSPPTHDPTQHPNPPHPGKDHPEPPAGGKGGGNGNGNGGGNGNGKGDGNPGRQSVYDFMDEKLKAWGLQSLAGHLKQFLRQGLSLPEIQLKLADTQEWKTRFAGNIARQKKGLAVLNPAQYLAMEESYHQTLRQAGIPDGYADKQATDELIGHDVSASEFADRTATAAEYVNNTPQIQQAFKQYYGMGKGGAIAAILDPNRAESVVKRQLASAEIGGAALESGFGLSRKNANQFATFGVSLSNARQAYQDVASHITTDRTLADRYGMQVGATEEARGELTGDVQPQKKLDLLYSSEAAQFGGHGGATTQSNSTAANY